MSIPIAYPYTFFLLFIRMLAFFSTAPVFSQRSIPVPAKIGLGALIAFVITPVTHSVHLPQTDMAFFAVLIQEVLVGLLLGFMAMLPITAVGLVGRFVSSSTSMAQSTSINPLSQDVAPPLGQFYTSFALLIFLLVRGDQMLLLGMKRMVDLLPPGQFLSTVMVDAGTVLMERVIFFTGQMWVVSMQLALPVVGVVLLSDLALGLITRAMPQMPAFALSMPLRIILGLLTIVMTWPYMWPQFVRQVSEAGRIMLLLFR